MTIATNSVPDILAAYAAGRCSAEDAAKALVQADLSGLAKALATKIQQSAREVLHYGEQAASAETSQWQASFAFERDRSAQDLLKQAKKALK